MFFLKKKLQTQWISWNDSSLVFVPEKKQILDQKLQPFRIQVGGKLKFVNKTSTSYYYYFQLKDEKDQICFNRWYENVSKQIGTIFSLYDFSSSRISIRSKEKIKLKYGTYTLTFGLCTSDGTRVRTHFCIEKQEKYMNFPSLQSLNEKKDHLEPIHEEEEI